MAEFRTQEKLEDAGIKVKIWLLDSDVNIPTVVVALDDMVLKDPALLVMGAGSHLSPEIAVTRALTEAAQSRVVQIHGRVRIRTGSRWFGHLDMTT